MIDKLENVIVFLIKWLKPMKCEGLAFTEMISGCSFYYYRDGFGRRWVKSSKYSFFKVKAKEEGEV